jgi:hypothetical protein
MLCSVRCVGQGDFANMVEGLSKISSDTAY